MGATEAKAHSGYGNVGTGILYSIDVWGLQSNGQWFKYGSYYVSYSYTHGWNQGEVNSVHRIAYDLRRSGYSTWIGNMRSIRILY